jgi:hypothetical protein
LARRAITSKSAGSRTVETASVCADHEISAHFELGLRHCCSHSVDPLIFRYQVDHLHFHSQTKKRAATRMFGNEIQKLPLRHEFDEFAVHRQMRKMRDGRFSAPKCSWICPTS